MGRRRRRRLRTRRCGLDGEAQGWMRAAVGLSSGAAWTGRRRGGATAASGGGGGAREPHEGAAPGRLGWGAPAPGKSMGTGSVRPAAWASKWPEIWPGPQFHEGSPSRGKGRDFGLTRRVTPSPTPTNNFQFYFKNLYNSNKLSKHI